MKNYIKRTNTSLLSLMVIVAMIFGTFIPVQAAEQIPNALKEVHPATVQTVTSKGNLKVTANSKLGATVTAKLDGKTIMLSPVADTITNDDFILYEGSFTIREVTAAVKSKNIGKVTFTTNYLGSKQQKYSGDITVVNTDTPEVTDPDLEPEPDPDLEPDPEVPSGDLPAKPKQDKTPTYPDDAVYIEPDGKKVKQIRVTANYANTFRYKSNDGYPNGVDYQLVEGTIDTIAKERGNWIDLTSGITLNKTNGGFTTFTGASYTSNTVESVYTHANIDGTYVSIRTGWDSPITITSTPQPSVAGTISSYKATQVEIKMPYIDEAPPALKGNFKNSPIFSSYEWKEYHDMINDVYGYKLILTLTNTGKYYGAHAYRDDTGRYTIRFNHAPYGIDSTEYPLTGLDILVDPGHGSSDPGSIGASGTYEKVYNLSLTKKIIAQLEEQGATVSMIPSDSLSIKADNRPAYIYDQQPDLFISVHHNSGSSTASGFEVYYNTPMSFGLGDAINKEMKKVMTARGNKYKNFAVTRIKQVPSVLLENCFISNSNDEKKYTTDTHQNKLAKATVDGIIAYYRS